MRMFMERTFAERLQDAMRQRGFKQVDLVREADKYGVKLGKSHMSQYVSGKTVPRAEILRFLANCLQVDADWLLTGEGDSRMVEGNTIHNVGEKNTARKAEDRESAEGKIEGKVSRKGSTQNRVKSGGSIMREFMKSSKLDNVLYDVRGPVVEEANRMEDAGTQVLKLNIGNPAPFGFRAPDEVIYDMRRQLADCEGYSPAKGMFSARKAIMQYAQLKHIPNVAIEDIYTGNGVSELINLSMSALLDSGDEVLVPSPDYPLWTACVTLAGGTAVHYLCDEQSEWYPDIEDIRKKINDRTKAIVIINPNNPTGALYPKEILEQIVELAREHELLIFADEIYDRLVMDGKQHISIASLAPDLCVVSFNGLSKSHLIAGYRCGWMCISGDKSRAKGYIEGINLLSSMRLCANVPTQSVIPKALEMLDSTKEMLEPGGRVYEQREYIYNALNDIPGVSAVKPEAAFYIFPKMDMKKFHIKDDEKFALDFLKEKKILVTHGGGFHWNTPDHFRIVYLPDVDTLTEACTRMKDFFAHYVQD